MNQNSIRQYIRDHKMKVGLLALAVVVLGGISIRAFGTEQVNPIGERVPKVSLLNVDEYQIENGLVDAIGEVEALQQIDLKSQIAERIKSIKVSIGQRVSRGQVLIEFDSTQLQAQLDQGQANLEAEKARLNELEKGTRTEEVQLQEVKVANAKTSLGEAEKSYINATRDSYTKADDIVHNTIDQFFTDIDTIRPITIFPISNPQLKTDLEADRFVLENTLNAWKTLIDELSEESDFSLYADTTRENLLFLRSFSEDLALAVNNINATFTLTQATIDAWKASVSGIRGSVNMSIASFSAAEEKLNNVQSGLTLAEKELVLKKAGSRDDQILSQEARVKSAEALVKNYEAQAARASITSPISGVVSVIPVRVGELINPGQSVISVINPGSSQVKAYINSKDLKLIQQGSRAVIENSIEGVVSKVAPSIDPTTRKIEVIVAVLDPGNSDLVIGQFANVRIQIAEELKQQDLFFLPLQAIKVEPDNAFVYTVDSEQKIVQHRVVLGRVIGDSIEVVEGVERGMVILFSVRGLEVGEKVEVQE